MRRNPPGGLSGKSAVYGLNGLRPMLRGCLLHLDPRTAFRALAPARLFPWGAKLSLRFRAKNMADDVFQLESELPNIPKLLAKPRPGSPCPRNSRAMVLLCCPGWDTFERVRRCPARGDSQSTGKRWTALDGAGCYHFCYHITSQNAPPVRRGGKRNVEALHLGADCLRPGTAGTVKPRYFLNRCSS